MTNRYCRREFLRTAAASGVGLTIAERLAAVPTQAFAEPMIRAGHTLETVRVGFVGVGHQGSSHVANFLKIDRVDIKAICDLVPEKVAKMQQLVVDAGRPRPAGYTGGADEYRRMCETEELDLVFTATPWEWHAPVCVAAMENGKHVATEVPMAVTVEECWQLVETAERTGRHCLMMENVCYGRPEMMILNMVRQGLLGELLHAECGYLHDLRELKLTDFYEGRWRVKHSVRRNGDLYPTHGLGPVAQYMNVNRGNQFDYLVAMSTNSRGLNLWAAEHHGAESAEARQRYALGDVVSTLIRTVQGQTILVVHDTDSPRPYSRKLTVQGTKGLVQRFPDEKIHVEGRSPAHAWEDLESYRDEFDHPLWKALEARSQGAGHGGMDYIEDHRLVQCLLEGAPTDQDVYDGAAWSAVSELSERSIAARGRPMDFPDFTRGRWKGRESLGIIGASPP